MNWHSPSVVMYARHGRVNMFNGIAMVPYFVRGKVIAASALFACVQMWSAETVAILGVLKKCDLTVLAVNFMP